MTEKQKTFPETKIGEDKWLARHGPFVDSASSRQERDWPAPEPEEAPWGHRLPEKSPKALVPKEVRLAEQLRLAVLTFRECVEVRARKCRGVPVLRGTRFTVPQLLAQLADDDRVSDIAEDFELEKEQISNLLHAMATYLNRPAFR